MLENIEDHGKYGKDMGNTSNVGTAREKIWERMGTYGRMMETHHGDNMMKFTMNMVMCSIKFQRNLLS